MTHAAAVDTGKIDIGRVIRVLMEVLKRNFATFLLLALLLYGLPSAIVTLLRADDLRRFQDGDFSHFGPGLGLGWLVGLVTSAILQGALTYAAIEDLSGRRASISGSLTVGLRAFLPLIGIAVLAFVGLFVGYLLLVVPGVILTCMWMVTVPAFIAERTTILGAFGRSAELTRGNRWRILGALLLWICAAFVVSLVIGFLGGVAAFITGGAGDPANPATVLTNAVTGSIGIVIGAAAAAVLYVELRKAREGGAAWMADIVR
ncbi:glycerophosphoryl diester phosphodiesterase membrane domain-containing protein [Phenylobacterium sp.]|uniref:glycerophosphoryl diester phosphodiesterase membrane domain-containing protein n=1 Tax=Phenylobacterium sp. TaxID=1871053 RepID=UPI00391CB31E